MFGSENYAVTVAAVIQVVVEIANKGAKLGREISSFHAQPRENVLLLNIFGRHAVRNWSRRKTEFRFGTCPGRPPRQGSLADIDQHRLIEADQPAGPGPTPCADRDRSRP